MKCNIIKLMIFFIVSCSFVRPVNSADSRQTILQISKNELLTNQREEPSASSKKPSASKKSSTGMKKNSKVSPYKKPAKFIPSEKIKADSSVPFPVDI
ncbi:MAG: hypothetical protein QNL62_12620 [Gammaproteobacteria bacterium]|nr:hypothetical protein [Gammaproteobacteria bacterium]